MRPRRWWRCLCGWEEEAGALLDEHTRLWADEIGAPRSGCAACNGSGVVGDWEGSAVECARCDGTGRVSPASGVTAYCEEAPEDGLGGPL